MRTSFFQIVFACLSFAGNAAAQHLHIQTSYSPAAGWNLFWYDFEAGAFPAGDFTQPVTKAARGQIPNEPVLTNALGAAGQPVWILPQVETSELPALGLGTQGSGNFLGGQIQLRLATFNGPGHLAIYTLDAFGAANLLVATRDGLTPADHIPMQFPGGHTHVNWAFTRPGWYQLGWQAAGTLAGGQFTNSGVTVFSFQVHAPAPPVLQLTVTNGWQQLRVSTEGNVPLQIETSPNLAHWTVLTNFWLPATSWAATNLASEPAQFYRASHRFP